MINKTHPKKLYIIYHPSTAKNIIYNIECSFL